MASFNLFLLPGDGIGPEVMGEVEHAYQLGVSGVPTFIIDSKYGISGAQEVETLVQAIRDIASKA